MKAEFEEIKLYLDFCALNFLNLFGLSFEFEKKSFSILLHCVCSVTRCLNKKYLIFFPKQPISFQSCPKFNHQYFFLKSDIFTTAKTLPNIWTNKAGTLVSKPNLVTLIVRRLRLQQVQIQSCVNNTKKKLLKKTSQNRKIQSQQQ